MNQTMTPLDHLRRSLAAVDPATLTGADKRALIDLLQAAMMGTGIE